LSISRRFVRALTVIFILFQASPGRPAFELKFPLAVQRTKRRGGCMKKSENLAIKFPSFSPETASAPSRRILVVDDEKGILDAYKEILTSRSKAAALKSSRSKTVTPIAQDTKITLKL